MHSRGETCGKKHLSFFFQNVFTNKILKMEIIKKKKVNKKKRAEIFILALF